MPRGLSKKAKKALVDGYNDLEAVPRGNSYMQRLADYVYQVTGERYSAKQSDSALFTLNMSTTFQRRAPGSGRGLSERAKELLVHGNRNRQILDTSNGVMKGLIAYIAANTHPRETYSIQQLERALAAMRRASNQAGAGEGEVGRSGAGGGSAYEVEAREEVGTSPAVFQHQHSGMMFSGADHSVVPNNEVHYDEQRQLYVDPQGQAVVPHWLDEGC
ncbi:hypothetical protein JCM8547_005217 [Rhodosporidiobolus lusitaniae]